jgi:hypothetical protein
MPEQTIKACNKADLMKMYNITYYTLNRWLSAMKTPPKKTGRYYTPAQVKILILHFSPPE